MTVLTSAPPSSHQNELSLIQETQPELMPEPDISNIIVDDGKPVDNIFSEKQQRLLTSSAYSSFNFDFPFFTTANVGLFYGAKKPPLVPDVMLSLKVKCPADWSEKKNQSYFTWNFGKSPEVAIEIVSNKVGHELDQKLESYLDAGVAYYIVFDPLKYLSKNMLQVYKRGAISYHLQTDFWLEEINLGLTLWSGEFEGQFWDQWLRWCDQSGNILLTGDEKVLLEKERANSEKQRADAEKERADAEKQRADRLAQILKEQGIDPNQI